MHKIAIVTDSTCDIPEELRQKYEINIVPLYVDWEGTQFLDGVDLSAVEFYERIEREPDVRPKTSLPTPGDFLHVFQRLHEEGAEEIVTITISSAMSGTIESARQAGSMVDFPVHFHDSKSNSMSLGWQVIAAARARELGGDAAAMLAAADQARQKLAYVITLDTMDYLFSGGRIGGAVSFLGSMLKIKPQITVNHTTGKVEAGEPARTRKNAIESLYKNFFRKVGQTGKLHVAVLHNAALPEAEALAARVKAEYHPEELVISIVSPVLGVHTGPRCLAMCGYRED